MVDIGKTQMIDTTSHEIQEKLAIYFRRENLESVNEKFPEFEFKETFYTKYGKRILDLLLSIPAFIVFLPINIIIGIVTLIFLGRPIFFTQERVGKNEKPFKLVKFRNMTNERDEKGELLPAHKRVTKIGKFLRKTSLDELLNFWSILKGDMSIIGPRALPFVYMDRYSRRHAMRFKVKPGLECPPITNLDHERSWHERLENDVWYVQNISFKTDCYMVYRLVSFALNKKNAKMRAGGKGGSFIGYTADGVAVSNYEIDDETIKHILEQSEGV